MRCLREKRAQNLGSVLLVQRSRLGRAAVYLKTRPLYRSKAVLEVYRVHYAYELYHKPSLAVPI